MNDLKRKIPSLEITIEGKKYEWHDQYITGAEIKNLASIPQEQQLYLSVTAPWNDELIENDTSINLARPGIESFKVRHSLTFTINEKCVKWHKQNICGSEIRNLGNIDSEDEIYLLMPKPFENEKIENNSTVDLARPGVEHFISQKPSSYEIIVNGMPKNWNKQSISFDEVIILAFGNIDYNSRAYTVTYSNGPKSNPKGHMEKGDCVNVKSKMNFNATPTNKS